MRSRKVAITIATCGCGVAFACLFFPRQIEWILLAKPREFELRSAFPDDAREVLERSPDITLYAFDWEKGTGKEWFHGCSVRGKMTVRGWEKRYLLDSLYATTASSGNMISMKCFDPHDGLHAFDPKTHKVVGLMLCFTCGNAEIYVDHRREIFHWRNDRPLHRAMNEFFRREKIPSLP